MTLGKETLMAYPNHFDSKGVTRCREQLSAHAKDVLQEKIIDYFESDPGRFDSFSCESSGLFLDYSKSRARKETLQLLAQLAEAAGLQELVEAAFSGKCVNHTEGRAVLHTALRSSDTTPLLVDGKDIRVEIRDALNLMESFVAKVTTGEWQGFDGQTITDIVSIGIGGSYLGPRVAVEALRPYWKPTLNCHFVSNIDGSDIAYTLEKLDPARTLFIIQSKSFKTQETLTNAETAKAWYLKKGGKAGSIAKHFVAVSSNIKLEVGFGIAAENIFPMWDWVGGRYSLWSAIGLPVALQVGMANFRKLLQGAESMDTHFRTAPAEKNLPVLLALLGIWYQNFLGAGSCVILPYDQTLENLAAHLQQVDMESNGKQVDRQGKPLTVESGVIIWGGAGTNGQHAYHQLLHQGTLWAPADFILPINSHRESGRHHAMLTSNCLAQSQALMCGKSLALATEELIASGMNPDDASQLAPHKVIPGNRPSHTITMDSLTPETLGALIALYEHKVMVQGAIWNVNSYDQWGVELGKQLCDSILPLLEDSSSNIDALDPSTAGLVKRFRARRTS
jgi:glucose-6-phosphate isomerase